MLHMDVFAVRNAIDAGNQGLTQPDFAVRIRP